MRLLRIFLVIFNLILTFATLNAKIPFWSINPYYEKINRYYGNIFAVEQDGKWGLMEANGNIVIKPTVDFITPFTNGYALAGINAGGNYLLQYIIDTNGKVNYIKENYYLPPRNQYFSDGKLAVLDDKGKYGYINTSGSIVVKCQFDNALPFKEGKAPVKQGNFFKYISQNYDSDPSRNTLPVDFHYGEMTLASCFTDGEAVVAYNKDYALINLWGKKVKKLKEKDFTRLYKEKNSPSSISSQGFTEGDYYTTFSNNGKTGLSKDDIIILEPQFDSFGKQYHDDLIVAEYGGKFGVLQLIEGNVNFDVAPTELNVDRKGVASALSINFKLPRSIKKSPRIWIDCGDGNYKDMSDKLSWNEGMGYISFSPQINKNADSGYIKGYIENDGIKIAEFDKNFSLSYPIRLRISGPGPKIIRANEDDLGSYSATIFNDSNKVVTVTATWNGTKNVTLQIPPHSSRSISETVAIKSEFSKEITLRLNTGESASTTIQFEPYF